MLNPVEWKFRPTNLLSDIKDSKKYKIEQELDYNGKPMKVISAVKEGITPEGKVAVYAKVRYFDEQSGTIKVGYAMEVEE
jgi:hypothetical protein